MLNSRPPLLRLMLWDHAEIGSLLLQRKPSRDGFQRRCRVCAVGLLKEGEGILRRASYSPGNALSRKNVSFLDDQLDVLYSSQQEPDRKQVEFYGHLLVCTFRRKT